LVVGRWSLVVKVICFIVISWRILNTSKHVNMTYKLKSFYLAW
jgi:hypothetical protein